MSWADDLERQARDDEYDFREYERELDDRRRQTGDEPDGVLAGLQSSADRAGDVMFGGTLSAFGAALVASAVFSLHAWQFGFMVGCLLLAAGIGRLLPPP